MDDNTDDAEREIALKETAAALTAEPYWGLARALEWVACRSLREMASLHLRPGRAFAGLFGSEIDGTLWLTTSAAWGGFFNEANPRAALVAALRQGKLKALGRRGGEWRTIEPYEWEGEATGDGLGIASEASGQVFVRVSLRSGYGRRAFDEVRFESADLLSVFRPIDAETSVAASEIGFLEAERGERQKAYVLRALIGAGPLRTFTKAEAMPFARSWMNANRPGQCSEDSIAALADSMAQQFRRLLRTSTAPLKATKARPKRHGKRRPTNSGRTRGE